LLKGHPADKHKKPPQPGAGRPKQAAKLQVSGEPLTLPLAGNK